MVAGVALVLQFVTSGRFEFLSGRIGIDVTMAFHKWSARALVVVILVHPLAFVMPWLLTDPARGLARLLALLVDPRCLTGTGRGSGGDPAGGRWRCYRDRLGRATACGGRATACWRWRRSSS